MRKSLLIFLALFLLFTALPACAQGNRARAEALTMQAKDELNSAMPQVRMKGIRDLEEAQKLDKNYPFSYLMLALFHKRESSYDKAEKQYLELVKLDGKGALVFKKPSDRALIYKGQGEIYILWAEEIERKDPVAGAAKSKIQRDKATKAFKKALSLKFGKDDEDKKYKKELLRALGSNYNAQKNYKEALAVLEKGLELDRDDAEMHLHKARALKGKKNLRGAEAEYILAAENAREGSALAETIRKDQAALVDAKKAEMLVYIKIGVAAAVVIIIIIALLVFLKIRSRSPAIRKDGGMKRRDSLAELEDNLGTPEGVCKMAVRKLSHVLQMPKGVIFLPNEEDNLLVPRIHYGMDRDVENLEMSKIDVRDWITEREGKPFIFKIERREVPYNRAFPDSSTLLGELEMRIGVPFLAQNNFLGIAYFGCKETKDKLKFKKIFESQLNLIVKIAEEASNVLHEIMIRKQAITDFLTGLYNETYFNERLPVMVDDARNNGKTCSVMMIQIDGYKEIMSNFGEDHGEKLVKMSAVALSSALADTGAILCRIADTKFAVIYPELSLDQATEAAEKIKSEVSSVKIARHIPPATASIGVGTFPATAIYAEKLLELVADALEKAQGEGGNVIQVAEKKLRTMETTRMTRDQVLAAVERRRQARKNVKTGDTEEKKPAVEDFEMKPSSPFRPSVSEPDEMAGEPPRHEVKPLPLHDAGFSPEPKVPLVPEEPEVSPFVPSQKQPLSMAQDDSGQDQKPSLEKRSPFGRPAAQPPRAVESEAIPLEVRKSDERPKPVSPFARRSPLSLEPSVPESDRGHEAEGSLPLSTAAARQPQMAPIQPQAEPQMAPVQPQARPPVQAPPPAQAQAQAQAQAPAADPLTGFLQRTSFEKALLAEAQRLSRSPGECTLLYCGIDGYEQVKSKQGPQVARKLIKEVSEKIKGLMHEGSEVPGRIEENGFAIFIPGASLTTGMDLAQRMKNEVSAMPFYEIAQGVSISTGIANYPNTVKSFREIILNSRKSMEKAMKSGGNLIEQG